MIALGRWADLPTVVPDDVLDFICIAGAYDTIVARVSERLEGLVDALAIGTPEPGHDERFADMLTGLRNLRGNRGVTA